MDFCDGHLCNVPALENKKSLEYSIHELEMLLKGSYCEKENPIGKRFFDCKEWKQHWKDKTSGFIVPFSAQQLVLHVISNHSLYPGHMIDATAFADYLQVHCHLMSQSMWATVQALNRLHPKVICIRFLTTDAVRKWMGIYNLTFVAAEIFFFKKGSGKQFSKYTQTWS